MSEQLASRDNEIEHLKLLIAKLRRMQFGRKSEKLDRQIEQLELRLDELQATRAENTAGSHAPAAAAPVASVRGKASAEAAARAPAARSAASIRRSRKLARTAAAS